MSTLLAQRPDLPDDRPRTRRRLSPVYRFLASRFAEDLGKVLTLLMIVAMVLAPFYQDELSAWLSP